MANSPVKISSYSSDDEFWVQLGNPPNLSGSPGGFKINLRSKVNPRYSSYLDAQKIGEIDRLREAKQIEIANVRRIAKREATICIEQSEANMK